ncbi:ATPase, histidine kinase-, DNA gyrase B-, and HSP90-like domain protein [Verrucomicrobiia bacterium DG1235]|nr:ATPase, histidine kinase-, DNA gyrase B-, and HSP90-like domain protein [Verrucomicrobiae bacterium DG1235]
MKYFQYIYQTFFLLLLCCATEPRLALAQTRGLSPIQSDAIAFRGDFSGQVFYANETGARSAIRGIASLPNGDLAILSEAEVFTFNGSNWNRITGINRPTAIQIGANGTTIIASTLGVDQLLEDGNGGRTANRLTPPEEYNFNIPTLEHVAMTRNHVFGMTGASLIEISPDGKLTLHRLPNWSNGCFTIDGELYFLGGLDGPLSRWDWTEKTPVAHFDSIPGGVGGAWILQSRPRAEGGVWLLNESQQILAFDGDATHEWPGNSEIRKRRIKVQDFVELPSGRIAIGSATRGLFVFDTAGNLQFEHNKHSGLEDNRIEKIGTDLQGGLWIATYNCLTRLQVENASATFDHKHGIVGDIKSIAFFNQRILLGASIGLYASQPNPKNAAQAFELILEQEDISNLFEYQGDLLIAGSQLSVMTQNGEIYQLPAEKVNSFLQPSAFPGLILASTVSGVAALRKENGKWEIKSWLDGAQIDFYSLAETKDHTVIGCLGDHQIARFELNDTGGSYQLENIPSYQSGNWTSLASIEGEIYLSGSPCLRWDSATKAFVEAPELIQYIGAPPYGFETVFGFSEEHSFAPRNARSSEMLPRPPKKIIGKIGTLGNDTDNRATCFAYDDAGNIWAAGVFGLARYSPVPPETKNSPIIPRIQNITSTKDNSTLPLSNGSGLPIALAPNQNSLKITSAFPQFSAAKHHQYQIFVDGLDTVRPDFSTSNWREITNLAPGHYTIYANAQDASGQIFQGEGLAIAIATPWSKTRLAYLLYFIAATLLVIGIVRYYNRVQIKRSKKLQGLVDERTKEIKLQNQRLEAQAEDLEEKNEELTATTETLSSTLRQLQEMQDQLVATARTAGKAEVAINVLHNVGNVLNSINVSLTLLSEKANQSNVSKLSRLADLIESQKDDIDTFLIQDPRGKIIPEYLIQLARILKNEIESNQCELDKMTEDVDHVKNIINSQQTHAKNRNAYETIELSHFCQYALSIIGIENAEHPVEIINEIPEHITIENDKHQLLDILLNLFANALEAIQQEKPGIGTIKLSVSLPPDQPSLVLKIRDNGSGIDPQANAKLFQHGFTTKPHGHGFGLHGSANAAIDLGGQLQLESDGPGKGATAILTLLLTAPHPHTI